MAFQTQAGAANASEAFKNPLSSLVSSGTITQDQADAVKSTLDSSRKAHRMPPPPPPPQKGGSIKNQRERFFSISSCYSVYK